ncbi:hypothetical protein DFR50_1386 [Roseiarcus fermentans]|uniref:Uncharacterized protein n=1 Tax=Roseiarcus fermentans TaxID=1473586 RepID=A0A366EQC9_9HYPH|nr:hypothetical protein DFR50_1386 [Roseiarcus fermentans]
MVISIGRESLATKAPGCLTSGSRACDRPAPVVRPPEDAAADRASGSRRAATAGSPATARACVRAVGATFDRRAAGPPSRGAPCPAPRAQPPRRLQSPVTAKPAPPSPSGRGQAAKRPGEGAPRRLSALRALTLPGFARLSLSLRERDCPLPHPGLEVTIARNSQAGSEQRRHRERSEAIQGRWAAVAPSDRPAALRCEQETERFFPQEASGGMGCFVASLLAMTGLGVTIARKTRRKLLKTLKTGRHRGALPRSGAAFGSGSAAAIPWKPYDSYGFGNCASDGSGLTAAGQVEGSEGPASGRTSFRQAMAFRALG